MGLYRTYFDKNNTIIKDSSVNTAKNPISELYCGENVSRFLFNCDFTNLKEMFSENNINLDTARHILKIKNTSDFDIKNGLNTFNDILVSDNDRSTSFDLELRPLTQSFDEGTGYDFTPVRLTGDTSYKIEPSNWFEATRLVDFTEPGAVNTNEILATQHFDNGNENVELDITDFVNSIITEALSFQDLDNNEITTPYGFILKYSDESETADAGITRTLGLYTKYTQTFYEPYIETTWDDHISDDRINFYHNKTNRLYLYVNVNGVPTNLDDVPTCVINETETYFPVHQAKGVYYVEITGNTYTETYVENIDVWSELYINGVHLDDVRLRFVPIDGKTYFGIGSTMSEPIKYGLSLSGIKFGETIDQGNIRKVNVLLRKPYTLNDYDFASQIYYRMYVKQGKNLVEVIDWQRVSKGYDTHFFNIDTSWMLPQTYYVDIKIILGGEVNIYNEQLKFTINNKIIH